MIITQTPFRMSFFGGGTDMPYFFNEYGGAVISTTFDKYAYVSVRHLPPYFDYHSHLTYSKQEYVNNYDEIQHPAIREAMKLLDMHDLKLTYDADLPAKSGLGTSSSFAVGMLNAFHCIKGHYRDKRSLAGEAIRLERDLCGEAGGWQDQIAAAYGGLNKITFRNNDYVVDPIIIAPERKLHLQNNLMLFFTGFVHFSADIQKSMQQAICKQEKISSLKEMLKLVDNAEVLLTGSGDLSDFGRMLDYAWQLKRGLTNEISTDSIDLIYERAKTAGALGGKLLGAGGGGFMIFYVEADKQKKVREALSDLLYIPFEFENAGTKVVVYEPEEYMDHGVTEEAAKTWDRHSALYTTAIRP